MQHAGTQQTGQSIGAEGVMLKMVIRDIGEEEGAIAVILAIISEEEEEGAKLARWRR